MNCPKRSDGTQVTRATVETTSNVRTNHGIQVFWKNQFFVFWWGPKKLFWAPKTLFSLRNPTFGGVHTSKTFLYDPWFWRFPWLIVPKYSYFAICSSKTIAWIKKLAILSFRTPRLEISTFSRKYFMSVFIDFRIWKTNFRSTTHPHPKDPSFCFSLAQHIIEYLLVW